LVFLLFDFLFVLAPASEQLIFEHFGNLSPLSVGTLSVVPQSYLLFG
jgi:hypothetical protein